MSTLAYAALTTKRDLAEPGTSREDAPPGVGTWVDALAALVPAEVLALHAVIISMTTPSENGQDVRGALVVAFVGLSVLSAALYVVPRLRQGTWDSLDYVRVFIPPLAFVGWTMLQRATAFDAVWPQLPQATRMVAALLLAAVLSLVAVGLGLKADKRPTKKKKH